MILPEYEWLPAASLGVVCLALILWLLRYARVMKPRRGTLEWIRRSERGRFSPFSLQPLRARGWIVLIAAPFLGLGYAVLTTGLYAEGYGMTILLAMSQSLLCALLFLLLFGAPVPAFCGTLMMTAAGCPSPLLLEILLLLLLSLACGNLIWQLCLLIPALIALFLFVGSGPPSLVLCVSYFLLYLLCAGLREPRPTPGVLLSLLILLAVLAAVFSVIAIQYRPLDVTAAEAILTEGKRLIDWKPVWLPHTKLPALLSALSIPALLMQARRLRNTGWLCAALAALLSLQMALCGNPELSYLGCAAALTGTFAGADHRGGRFMAIITAVLLTVCIFIF